MIQTSMMQKQTDLQSTISCRPRGLASGHRSLVAWTIEKLNIQPYQHILEIGYGNGYALQEIGKKLRAGFLAGVDNNAGMLQLAYRRNRDLAKKNMLALHVGNAPEIPYPPNYFHSVFGIDVIDRWKEPAYGLLQLIRYIKSSGSLLMIFHSKEINNRRLIRLKAENTRQQFAIAGFQDVEIDFQILETQTGIAVRGYKE